MVTKQHARFSGMQEPELLQLLFQFAVQRRNKNVLPPCEAFQLRVGRTA
jgi:hypothetical protein